jgi:hypothetical protein
VMWTARPSIRAHTLAGLAVVVVLPVAAVALVVCVVVRGCG